MLQARRLVGLSCDGDCDWVVQLLRCAAPRLEELQLLSAPLVVLAELPGLPQLRRLQVDGQDVCEDGPEVPAPAPAPEPGLRCSLQWLDAFLSRPTLRSLLAALGSELRELRITVGNAFSPHFTDCYDFDMGERQTNERAAGGRSP